MREYRGKRKDNGKWVYGSLWVKKKANTSWNNHYIWILDGRWVEVVPETVGQSTGKQGIKGWTPEGFGKGQELYEDDIIDFPTSGMSGRPYLIESVNRYEKTAYGLNGYPYLEAGRVIGNVHENPKLMVDK